MNVLPLQATSNSYILYPTIDNSSMADERVRWERHQCHLITQDLEVMHDNTQQETSVIVFFYNVEQQSDCMKSASSFRLERDN
jgi:hypothetical protein